MRTTWAIANQEQRMPQLTAQATDLLAETLDTHGLMIFGPIQWQVQAGDIPRLTATYNVRRIRKGRRSFVEDRRSAGATPPQVAADLGITVRSLTRWAYRNGDPILGSWSHAYEQPRTYNRKPSTCIDCGTSITHNATRCRPCANTDRPTIKQLWQGVA